MRNPGRARRPVSRSRPSQTKKRGLDAEPGALDPRPRAEIRRPLEGLEKLGPAIGVARVVQRIRPDEDVVSAEGLAQGDRVARNRVLRAGT